MLLLAWSCTNASTVANDSCKSSWAFKYTADANFLFFFYTLLNVTIFKHIWLLCLPCVCFFKVFAWHWWSSCTWKVRKYMCVVNSCVPAAALAPRCVRVCGMAAASLYSGSVWKMSNSLPYRTSCGDLYCYGCYYPSYCWAQLRFGLGNDKARLGFFVCGHSRLPGWILAYRRYSFTSGA